MGAVSRPVLAESGFVPQGALSANRRQGASLTVPEPLPATRRDRARATTETVRKLEPHEHTGNALDEQLRRLPHVAWVDETGTAADEAGSRAEPFGRKTSLTGFHCLPENRRKTRK